MEVYSIYFAVCLIGSKQGFEVAGTVNYPENRDLVLFSAIEDQMSGESGD
jgi:hypothetical protein